nr:MAG TPA: hypothetical protein [Caudoviricetes sp.]
MAKNGYAQKVALARETYLKIGQDFGVQKTADLLAIALNDPEVMGKALGEKKIRKILERMLELEKTFNAAFYANPEQDYWQEMLDRRLGEIFGTETVPFRERYPWLKEVKYGR